MYRLSRGRGLRLLLPPRGRLRRPNIISYTKRYVMQYNLLQYGRLHYVAI